MDGATIDPRIFPARRAMVAPSMTVEPMPPVVPGRMPWVGSGLRLLAGPAAFFARPRGVPLVLDAFGFRLFCVFSPAGVRRLYELPEQEASFGLATYNLLTLKIP